MTIPKVQTKDDTRSGADRFDFSKRYPRLSRIEKKVNKIAMGAAIAAVVAIGGANLGTYFDYTRNNYDYAKLGNKTTIRLSNATQRDALVEQALRTAKVAVVGHTAPQEASVELKLDRASGILSAHYQMVWNTNRGMEKRDVEDITIAWKLDQGRFVPRKAVTRYHYKTVDFDLPQDREPVILIQNPAHTPGIPGTVPHYKDNDYGVVDVFTDFSAVKWTGSCLSTGLPQKFGTLEASFEGNMK